MKNKTHKNRDEVFNEALDKAHLIYAQLWIGCRSPDFFHRIHISPTGEVTVSLSTSRSRDSHEYGKRTPHPLTLWEIVGREEIFEAEEMLGNDYYVLKALFTSERNISENEDEWSDHDAKEFNKRCVDAYKGSDHFVYPDHRDLKKKRADFEDWANENLI